MFALVALSGCNSCLCLSVSPSCYMCLAGPLQWHKRPIFHPAGFRSLRPQLKNLYISFLPQLLQLCRVPIQFTACPPHMPTNSLLPIVFICAFLLRENCVCLHEVHSFSGLLLLQHLVSLLCGDFPADPISRRQRTQGRSPPMAYKKITGLCR